MATSFPSSLDSFTNPLSSDTLSSPSHAGQHTDLNDAVAALQSKVGIDSSADTSSHDYLIADLLSRIATLEAAGSPMKKVAAFTSSGTWTVPSGVTYAIAHIRGGGGGAGRSSTGGQGGTSSVAFAGGTVTAVGGNPGIQSRQNAYVYNEVSRSGNTNSGAGAHYASGSDGPYTNQEPGFDGVYIVAGDDVTPGASITVTVGAGGTAGTGGANGGSGYVWIEYQES